MSYAEWLTNLPWLGDGLADWREFDEAGFRLAVLLGIFDPMDWLKEKHRFWNSDPLGEALLTVLEAMVERGVLEKDEDGPRYRWAR